MGRGEPVIIPEVVKIGVVFSNAALLCCERWIFHQELHREAGDK